MFHLMSKRFKAIAAMSLNRVIGKDNDIPWRIPEDWKWVKQKTSGHIIVMGRRTFESLGRRPLPNRENIVVSRTLSETEGFQVIRALSELNDFKTDKEIWIFGGAEIYRSALPKVDELFLTVVNRVVNGDVFFPEFEEEFDFEGFVRTEPGFRIKHYRRRTLP